jgi:exopolysaccharide biosynthesis polyprenyl glycosylphosphotransferase
LDRNQFQFPGVLPKGQVPRNDEPGEKLAFYLAHRPRSVTSIAPMPVVPIVSPVDRRTAAPAARRLKRHVLLRRSLVTADLAGLTLAFAVSLITFGLSSSQSGGRPAFEAAVFLLSLPAWVVLASVFDLYRYDGGRIGHSTADELFGVIQLVTLGAWLFFVTCWVSGISNPRPDKLVTFWLTAIAAVAGFRATARALCQRAAGSMQRTVILGGGDVGQLVARKLIQHPEYRIHLVGFIDDAPKARRADLPDIELIGALDQLRDLVDEYAVDRVIVAFSQDSDARTAAVVRTLRTLDVEIDIVPRLYELLGPQVDMHAVEGLPLVGVRPISPRRSALGVKRALDLAGASLILVFTAPLFAYIAWRVHRSSPGPVFFRQERLGHAMREFTVLKFRTMRVDADAAAHRAFIAQTMDSQATLRSNGLYKLDRRDDITPFGSWLRRTSLDELPQLINVLRGDMSLVGPRPCIPYEIEHFQTHHFERFLMPQGLTGLWQVTARASASFGEALDMDVSYVRGWSLGLDLRLLIRTPVQLLRTGGTA